MRDHQPHVFIAPDQRAHGGGGEFRGAVVGMALARILEPHGQHQGQPGGAARRDEHSHLRSRRLETVMRGIAAHHRRAAIGGLAQRRLPPGEPGMDGRHRFEAGLPGRRLVQPRVAVARRAPEEAGQVTHPRLVDGDAVHGLEQRVG